MATAGRVRYLMMSGSNAERIGDALVTLGRPVAKLTKGGWKPNQQGVEELLARLEVSSQSLDKGVVIVFAGFDNGCYYGETEDGERVQPKRDEKGTYHVPGKVVVAGPRQVKTLMGNCRKVMAKVEENRKVIVGPGPRFLRARCCKLPGHCTNVGEDGFRRDLFGDLQEAKDAISE